MVRGGTLIVSSVGLGLAITGGVARSRTPDHGWSAIAPILDTHRARRHRDGEATLKNKPTGPFGFVHDKAAFDSSRDLIGAMSGARHASEDRALAGRDGHRHDTPLVANPLDPNGPISATRAVVSRIAAHYGAVSVIARKKAG